MSEQKTKMKLVSIPGYAKITGIARQSVYERVDRGTIPVFMRPKNIKMVPIEEDLIPEDYDGEVLDIDRVQE